MSDKAYYARFSQLLQKLLRILYLKTRHYSLLERITFSEYKVLSFLSNVPSAEMSRIKNNLNITGAFATNIVDKLVKNKLVIRQRSEDDRRKIIIAITDNGRLCLKRLTEHKEKLFNKLFGSLQEKEKKAMEKGILILVNSLEK
ncbi:MAG: MarR family transcriptional regulator [Candidatus Omnitrophica bacterium]|nr:MarR family transcriptional regulator [Candidatus Omnitrophota bacterium]